MSFEFVKKLPTPSEIRAQYPVPENLAKLKEERDREIRDVITFARRSHIRRQHPHYLRNRDR